jgi:hypothetical protein
MDPAEILAQQGVEQDGRQHEGQGAAQALGMHLGQRPGAHEAAQQGRAHRRPQRGPAQLHPARELPRRPGRAPDGAALVGAHQRGRRGRRIGGEQGRHQDQAATAHDGIDTTGQPGGRRHQQQIPHRQVRKRETEALCTPEMNKGASGGWRP